MKNEINWDEFDFETIEEPDSVSFDALDPNSLRFAFYDKDNRLVVCVNHPDGVYFGLRLHPPHLYDLRQGRLFYRNSDEEHFQPWTPNYAENIVRFNKRLYS